MARGNRFRGKSRLLRILLAIPEAQKTALLSSLDRSADELVAAQRALVEVDEGTARASIRKEPGSQPLSVAVTAGGPTTTKPVRKGQSATYDYVLGLEFGTQDMAARPFFYAPYRLQKKRIARRAIRAARMAARKARGR